MPDDPDPGPATPDAKNPQPAIRDVAGDVIFHVNRGRPDIPLGKQRLCPQCDEFAWADSRWCWNCRYDFDRAECARWHPKKMLALSLIANVLLACLSLYLAAS